MTLMTLDSSILSLLLLIILHKNANSGHKRLLLNQRLYLSLVRWNMAMIVIDILSRVFDGKHGLNYMLLNKCFNLVLFVFEFVPLLLWIIYIDFQVFNDEKRLKKVMYIILIPFFINATLSVASLWTRWLFTVDAYNIYHRGNHYWLHISIPALLMVYSFIFIFWHRKMIEHRFYYSLLLFSLPQIIGTIIQIFRYGVSYSWSGMMLSLLIIYFNIQNRDLNTDFLTGVYNRRQLDIYLKTKINASTEKRTFSAIMIDLNEFKLINDKYGHECGDEALQATSKIIRSSLRRNDFVARYGGDEFFIILTLDNRQELEATVTKILSCVENYNRSSQKPYKLSFSMGYDLYNTKLNMNSDQFFSHIDALMYENKNLYKYENC